ncbi:hypothetical protein FA951_02380 [Dermacoccus nishinomiyaensis]|uniref:hypothetical protein n=2 Tax=Dermacoccus TaxID=57495 RepID=UPI0010AD20E7|nr:hypothetical protein [Dermacoccus nishinomiyaensis]TJZ98044.1 hypothetical protein FA951_02380 [Dermacoccus nishinomiyaensis]
MIVAIIAACEILFWVFVIAGLAARYLLERRRLGAALLVMAPVTDLVLLAATAISLHRGDAAHLGHVVAAVYIGFSVAYGHRMIDWCDTRFAHRFAAGPAPVKATGATYTRQCWADVARTSVAAAITCMLTAVLIAIAADTSSAGALSGNYTWMGMILGLDVLWAVSYTLCPRRASKNG